MAHTPFWYGQHFVGQYSTTAARRVDFATDTIKLALVTNTYTIDQDAHDFFNDITNEVTGTGYTAGGVTLTGKSAVYDAASNEFRLIVADAAWGPGATFGPFRKGVIYKDTGTASTSPLIGGIVWDSDQSVSNGTYTVDTDPTGILYCTLTANA